MKLFHFFAASSLLIAAGHAQTQLVRGDVDSVQGTNRFVLACTTIQLVSRTVNLQQLHDQSRQQDIEYEMQVRDVSAGGKTILDVVSAKAIPELFDMGNLRLGRADRWQVMGAPGSATAVYITATGLTGYTPVGAAGTWLLGNTFFFLHAGAIGNTGLFQFSWQPPDIQGLVGQSFAAQAIVLDRNGGLLIANAQCKEVRAR